MNVLLAEGVNLGLRKMAAATNTHSFWELLRIARWHVEGSAYDRALAMIVEAHAALPMAAFWGQGQSASSDGQFFLATEQGEAMNLINAKYGNVPGLKGYSHVSDQYAPFATQVIPATVSEAPYILDGLLMNDAGRRVRQHFADTGGFTDHVFAACALLGYRFAPRIRDLPQKRFYAFTPNATPPMCERWSAARSMNRSSSATGPTSCASRRRSQRGSPPPARFFANSPLTRARMNWPWHCARSAASSAPCS
jgi:TnpA family transposase